MIRLSIHLLASLALVACVARGGADETALTPEISKKDWSLAEVDGKAPGWTATLNLGEPGRITGQAPCNRYFADVTRDGTSFMPGLIGATKMACLQIDGEAEFFALLSAVTTAEMGPGSLILSGGGHQMRFVQPIP